MIIYFIASCYTKTFNTIIIKNNTIIFFDNIFLILFFIYYIIFKQISKPIAHNVPAVYDVLAARISKCEAFAGRTKCGGVLAWE
jgi:hypothetical protein